MFKDQLFLAIAFRDYGVPIETPNAACELDAADEINGDQGSFLTRGVQKAILNVLGLLFRMLSLLRRRGIHGSFPRSKLETETRNSKLVESSGMAQGNASSSRDFGHSGEQSRNLPSQIAPYALHTHAGRITLRQALEFRVSNFEFSNPLRRANPEPAFEFPGPGQTLRTK